MGLGRILERQRQRMRRQSMRLCDGCHAALPRQALGAVDGRWLCAACAKETELDAIAATAPAFDGEEAQPAWRPWVWLGVRLALYLLTLWLAHSSRLLGMALRGALLGDVMGWGVERLAALRKTRLVALFEFFGFLAVVRLCYDLPGALSLPPDAEDRGVVGLAFMTVFIGRVLVLVLRLRLEPDEDDPMTW